MTSRLMQIYLPGGADPDWDGLLEGVDVLSRWTDDLDSESAVVHLLLPADQTESVMDRLEDAYGNRDGFSVVMLAVEASLPRPTKGGDEPDDEPGSEALSVVTGRISREELYTDISESLGAMRNFVVLVSLSAIVAAVGLMKNDVAVIVGAMVIAPLLGPNVAMSLASTLGDRDLLMRALKSNVVGLLVALLVSVAFGFLFEIDPTTEEIARRTDFGLLDLLLAFAAGSAGTFAFTSGLAGAVIGVMVAVALVPPLVAGGMLLGAGHYSAAFGAFLLTTANMASINLAGVATFLLQGVAPRTWWEEKKARKMTRRAVVAWMILILLLVGAFILRRMLGAGA
ncbi:MAG: TIGR00341 family protein [Rhodothermales bacterium]|nr:TIGR00341 family protein [Rhodothermales bacterium]